MTMDANALYYTFSTIAQTLAGAFGFLLAVALYRIQSIETVMAETVGKIRRVDIKLKVPMYWDYDPFGMEVAHLSRDWDRVASILKDAPVKEGASADRGLRYYPEMSKIFRADKFRLNQIKGDLARAMSLTGWTVASCLVVLPLSGPLSSRIWTAAPSLIAGVGAALVCIRAFYPLIREVTQ